MNALVGVQDHAPLPLVCAVQIVVPPSVTVTVEPGSAVPPIVGRVLVVVLPLACVVMTGASGAVVSPGVVIPVTVNVTESVGEVLPASSAATAENVRLNVQKLTTSDPILSGFVKEGKLKIVGGVYDIATGKVNLV